ncbi:MAG TPA: carbon-nitrogen hydrolase family protein [bacterium]|nr:carbon-nitrogen hydrolase family protein [bacterium]
MNRLVVALLQMAANGSDQDANLRKGDEFCRRAKTMGADVALFPEMWNIGYTSYPGTPGDYDRIGTETPEVLRARAAWQAQAISRDGPFVRHFRDLARELEMAIAITYLEAWPGAPRNSNSLIDRRGEILFTYAKMHTCDFDLEGACTPGEDFYVAQLDTAAGPVQVGAMICFDREFPESARILMLKNAELILVPNACWMEPHRLRQLQSRAFENMVAVAMANYGGGADREANGHSAAYDGIAFAKDGSRDMTVVEAGVAEGVYLAPFDLNALRDYRSREVWGNAFRRPHRYSLLTSPEVKPPFVRRNALGEAYEPVKR